MVALNTISHSGQMPFAVVLYRAVAIMALKEYLVKT